MAMARRRTGSGNDKRKKGKRGEKDKKWKER